MGVLIQKGIPADWNIIFTLHRPFLKLKIKVNQFV